MQVIVEYRMSSADYERKMRSDLYYNRGMENIQSLSDEQLVHRVRLGDKDLYRLLVDRYQEKLMRYANYLSRNEHKAADIVQETFIKAYVNLNGFDLKKKFSSWIYRIAHNESINSIKKYRRELPLKSDFDISSSEDLEEDFSTEEIKKSARKCLDSLPVIYAEPLSLYYLEDRSYEEISDILRLPMGTVATRINRAKALMKKICQNLK